MTVTTAREASEDLRARRDEVPPVAGSAGWRADVQQAAGAWRPAADISERGDAYVVTVDLPDVKASEIDITIEDGLLTIQGRRHAARPAAGEKVHRAERGDGVFHRQLTLPGSHVKAGESQVSARDGVLEIVVPKASQAQAGLIRVHASQANAAPAPERDAREQHATPGTTGCEAAISPAPPAGLRLRLQPDRSAPAPLDGGWWPRSADPAAELPGLILALDARHGRVTRVMLGAADWDASRPRRVQVDGPAGSRVVKLGWFAAMPAGLLTAISAGGQRTDLVTIPTRTGEHAAAKAMEQAARAGNREHAPAILAAITAPPGLAAGSAAG